MRKDGDRVTDTSNEEKEETLIHMTIGSKSVIDIVSEKSQDKKE